MEVKDVLENYTNLEKECESAKQPISIELQVYKNMFIIFNIQIVIIKIYHYFKLTLTNL